MYLVTGGNGLVGRALVRLLLERGERVRVLDFAPSHESAAESVIGDLRDPQIVNNAVKGVKTVFHCAAMVDVSLGRPKHVYDVNVAATQNLLIASKLHDVGKFIYTSSIDVVFDGSPIRAGDERLPYASKYLDFYGESKALAEKAVLRVSNKDMLTCAIRPAGVYGAGDVNRFPNILKPALKGQFTQLGDGKALFNHVYADNVAYMHLLAADKLALDHPSAGSAYFATDYAPSNFFGFFHPYLEALGIQTQTRVISERSALMVARLSEWAWRIIPTKRTAAARLTRYVIYSTCRDFWFTSRKAELELGYTPLVTQQSAFERTMAWLQEEWLPAHR